MRLLNEIKQKTKQLKSEVDVLIVAYKDRRTPLSAKLLVGITVGYLLSPIDLIPDFIPVLGLLDDLIIVPLLIIASRKLIPPIVLAEAREAVKLASEKPKKDNWIFAVVIIVIWLVLIFFVYRLIRHKPS